MPTMVGAFVFDLYANRKVLGAGDVPIIAVGFVSAFVVALIVVHYLLDYVSKRGYALFGWWRLVVGGLGLAALAIWG
jgi:undecaprenyl-diphosphatase